MDEWDVPFIKTDEGHDRFGRDRDPFFVSRLVIWIPRMSMAMNGANVMMKGDPSDAEMVVFGDLVQKLIEKEYHIRFNAKVYKYFHKDGDGFDSTGWVRYLDWMERNGWLKKHHELCCGECGVTVEVHDRVDESLIGTEKECNACGSSFIVDRTSWMVFNEILPAYFVEINSTTFHSSNFRR